jgi:hypothetical protein
MAYLTLQTQTIGDWQYGGSTAYLYIWSSQAFYEAVTGEYIAQGQVNSLDTFYQKITCTVSGTTLTIPEVVLATTTDSTVANAVYTATLATASNRFVYPLLQNFFVDPEYLASSTQSSVEIASAGTAAINGLYTYRGQTGGYSYYNLQGQSASTTLFVVKNNGSRWIVTNSAGTTMYDSLSQTDNPWDDTWEEDAGALPVPTVSENTDYISGTWEQLTLSNQGVASIPPQWPGPFWNVPQTKEYVNNLVGDGTTPFASATVIGKSELSVDPDLASLPIALGENDPRVMLTLGYYGTVAQAIVAIGATPTTLLVTENTTISTAVTVPSTLNFQPVNGAMFVKSGSGTLTFDGFGITGDPQCQVFSGFSAGNVTWTSDNVPPLRPEWWGAKGDGVTDDLVAFDCINAVYTQTQGGTFTGSSKGTTVWLADGATYYCSDTVEIERCTYFGGTGGYSAYSVPRILVPANKTGLIVYGAGTKTGTATTNVNAIGTHLRSFVIEATSGAVVDNTVLDATGLTFTLTGGTIASVSLYGSNNGSTTNLAPGSTITLNNFPYVVDDTIGTSPTTTVPIQVPRFSCTSNGTTTLTLSPSGRLPDANDWVGQTITIYQQLTGDSVTRTITAQTTSTVTVNSSVASGFAFYATVAGVNALSAQDARINVYHGIDYRAFCKVEGVTVVGFNGNGHHLQSVRYPSPAINTTPNLNLSTFFGVYAQFVSGTGFCVVGGNTNQIEFMQVDAQECRGWGIYESASSGNNYTFHASNNTAGPFKCASNISNSVLMGCYAESSQPPPYLASAINIWGGTWGTGFGTNYQPNLSNSFGYTRSTQSLSFHRPTGTYLGNQNTQGIRTNVGSIDVAYGLFEMGVGSETFNTGLGGTTDNCAYAAIKWGYNTSTGRYDLRYGTAGNIFFSVSGSNAAEGAGYVTFPNGMIVTGEIQPSANDASALGDATHNFSDLFLATGALLNYANGNVVVTHSSGILTMGTGELRITTPGTNSASVPTLGSTSTLTNKTLTSPTITNPTVTTGSFTSPALTTPTIGVATGTSLAVTGLITSSGTAGVGYATGAGGTVTQATSKVTAFTLSKTTGQITFAADQLDAGETNSATWTNTTIAATDVVVFNHVSGGTIGAYDFNAQCGSGTATINITNRTAGNLSESPVVQFCVIKGAIT